MSGRPSISRTITGRMVAVEQPGYVQAYGYEYDRLTTTYQTRGLCVLRGRRRLSGSQPGSAAVKRVHH